MISIRHFTAALAAFIVLLAAVASAQTREPNHRVTNATHVSQSGLFGERVITIDDLDGDGFQDYAVAASSFVSGGAAVGRVYVFSGLTAQILQTFDGIQSGVFFGQALADAGDVNGDGVRDIVITARNYSSPTVSGAGRVTMFSGATGAELWSYEGPGGGSFGKSVAVITNGTLTGASSVVVGHPGFSGSLAGTGRVVYLDPVTGIYQDDEEGAFAFDNLGTELFASPATALYSSSGGGRVHLLDGPGGSDSSTLFLDKLIGGNLPPQIAFVSSPTPGLVIGRSHFDSNGFINNGAVQFFPFGSSIPTISIEGGFFAEGVGGDVIAGDFDGDGDDEIGFSSNGGGGNFRFRITELNGTVLDDVLVGGTGAGSFATLRDTTGDGRDEWIQGLNGGIAGWYETQVFAVGMDETIVVDPANTRFEYQIDVASSNGGNLQFTFFGASGAAPGTVLESDKPLFPLNFDVFTSDALSLLGSSFFPDSLSFLDPAGRVVTSVVVPNALAMAASGFEFWAASAVLDFPSLEIAAVTNPIRSVFP